MPQSQANVIIIGANFAGLNTAKHLDAKEFVVTVIDSQTHFEWLLIFMSLFHVIKKQSNYDTIDNN